MKELETEHKSAGKYSWFAERDARLRSVVNSSRFSDIQKLKAERVKLALEMCVFAKQVYIEYRQKFISVKVHKPGHIDRKTLDLFENDWKNDGILGEKVNTKQGVTYRLFQA